jgi:hypothetical protein
MYNLYVSLKSPTKINNKAKKLKIGTLWKQTTYNELKKKLKTKKN